LTAAVQGSIATTGDNKLSTTFLTNISLSRLICHFVLHLLVCILNSEHEIFWLKVPAYPAYRQAGAGRQSSRLKV
jgi:hypothetical protein